MYFILALILTCSLEKRNAYSSINTFLRHVNALADKIKFGAEPKS